MTATIYIAPAVTEIGSRCNVYHIPYGIDRVSERLFSPSCTGLQRDMKLIGTLEWDYMERNFRIVCLDRSLVGDLTDDDFKNCIGGTYYLID